MFESPRRGSRNCQKENGRSELDQCSNAKGKSLVEQVNESTDHSKAFLSELS